MSRTVTSLQDVVLDQICMDTKVFPNMFEGSRRSSLTLRIPSPQVPWSQGPLVFQSKGGCALYGTAPFCDPDCPQGTAAVKDTCSFFNTAHWFSGSEDRTYRGLCFLGCRSRCCRIDATDNTWEGTWDSALEPDGAYYMCNYHIPIDSEPSALYHRRCGLLRCGKHTLKEIAEYTIYLDGTTCTNLRLVDDEGTNLLNCTALLWHLIWKKNGVKHDSWFKANHDE